MTLDPHVAPRTPDDLRRWKLWVEAELKRLRSSAGFLKRSTVPGSVTTIHEVLTDPNGSFAAWDTDTVIAAADDALVTLTLTYVPLERAVIVRKNGNTLEAAEFSRVGNVITISPGPGVVIRAGDRFSAWYLRDTSVATPPAPEGFDDVIEADSPILWARLGEANGTAGAGDHSGHGRDGAYGGTITYGQPAIMPGLPGTSVDLGGAGYVEWAPGEGWQRNPEFTAEVFVDVDDNTGTQFVMGCDDLGFSDSDRVWHMVSPSAVRTWTAGGGMNEAGTLTALTVGPHHLVMVCKFDPVGFGAGGGTYIHMYDNNVEIAPPAAIATMNTSTLWPLTLGVCADGQVGRVFYLKGRAQHFLLYDHGLTPARIAAHYAKAMGA